MRYMVLIEETLSEEFTVDAGTAEEAEEKVERLYSNSILVLEPGNLEEVRFMAFPAEEQETSEMD